MIAQRIRTSESFVAPTATERLDVHMDTQVLLQMFILIELFVTHLANISFFTSVNSRVHFQVESVRKPLATLAALELFFSAVHSQVAHQKAIEFESFSTYVANEWFLVTVRVHVFL